MLERLNLNIRIKFLFNKHSLELHVVFSSTENKYSIQRYLVVEGRQLLDIALTELSFFEENQEHRQQDQEQQHHHHHPYHYANDGS